MHCQHSKPSGSLTWSRTRVPILAVGSRKWKLSPSANLRGNWEKHSALGAFWGLLLGQSRKAKKPLWFATTSIITSITLKVANVEDMTCHFELFIVPDQEWNKSGLGCLSQTFQGKRVVAGETRTRPHKSHISLRELDAGPILSNIFKHPVVLLLKELILLGFLHSTKTCDRYWWAPYKSSCYAFLSWPWKVAPKR